MYGRGVAGSILLVLGGFCYARVPRPSFAHDPFLTAVRASPGHLTVGLLLCASGLAVLTWAWWDLRLLARDDEHGVRAVRIAAACWSVPLLVAPPLFSGDGWSYVATGFLTSRGLSPYVYTPSVLPAPLRSAVNERWLNTPSPYGPLALGWGGASARLTSDPWLLLLAYRLFALVGLALLAWAAPRLARRSGRHPGAASWLVVASPFVLAHGIGGLHNDLVVAGLGAAALAVSTRERWALGAVLVGAAAAVKVPGGLVGVGVVLLSLAPAASGATRIRRGAEVVGVATATVLALGVAAGVGTGWVGSLSVPGSMPSTMSLSHDLGSALGLVPGLGAGSAVPVVQATAIGVMALAAVVLVLRCPVRRDPPILLAVAFLMLGVTLFSPAVHYWYFLWCLPLLGCVALSPFLRAALVGAIAVLGLTAIADPSLHLGGLTVTAQLALLAVPALAYAGARVRDPGTSSARSAGAPLVPGDGRVPEQ